MSDPYEVYEGSIPEQYRDILEAESFAHLATVGSDGDPQSTPLWVDHEDGEYVLLNTRRGRQKERNIRENPAVAVSVLDPENPSRYLSVRGEATLSEDGAAEHIDELARQYLDVDRYPYHEAEPEPRVIIRVPADHVVARSR